MQQFDCTVWIVPWTWFVTTGDLQWPHATTPVALKTGIFNSLGVKHSGPRAHHTNNHGHINTESLVQQIALAWNTKKHMNCLRVTRVNYWRTLPTTKVKEDPLHLKLPHRFEMIGRPINWEPQIPQDTYRRLWLRSCSVNAEHCHTTLLEQWQPSITTCVNEMQSTVLSAGNAANCEASTWIHNRNSSYHLCLFSQSLQSEICMTWLSLSERQSCWTWYLRLVCTIPPLGFFSSWKVLHT